MESDEEETVLRHNCGSSYAEYERASDRGLLFVVGALTIAAVVVLLVVMTT